MEHILVHELRDSHLRMYCDGRSHDVTQLHVLKPESKLERSLLVLSRVLQKHSDQQQPDTGNDVSVDDGTKSERHQCHRENPADTGCRFSCFSQISAPMPQIRAQHTPAVERKTRNQIESGEE